ncbi:hypothetical protein Kpol_1037p49 [Vanderwaltozyma polyspora DSM 70294]|uniref:chitin synthase n=1 Tax=Vanderwaltozyma polyspora (strain ATCC 22028 / DSM 70294 / BCRC 21397 / CBS 2163 / NBRC 10782 / NRRL Y-8283 / UCD 57-17) TaxID=436907 RepID=A7TJZ0_VANPO|nr:uncharacterized protein Kpol_1037p49 [Vanderwaltozyma polyspora DSM 70294]EDO17452.1 hypothetical protein Kpol_1037p49 [Vanderwaltozyma polyspora DSM 70294]
MMKGHSDDYYVQFDQDNEGLLNSNRGSLRSNSRINRQNSLIRPERNRLNNPDNPHYYYVQKTKEQRGKIAVQPSSTGLDPNLLPNNDDAELRSGGGFNIHKNNSIRSRRTGHESLGKESDIRESIELDDLDLAGLQNDPFMKSSIQIDESTNMLYETNPNAKNAKPNSNDKEKESLSLWQLYCYIITFWAPAPLLSLFGMPKKERQMAWREKIALISIIFYLGAFVAYITFGFSRTVCKDPPIRFKNNQVSTSYLIINGKAYNLDSSSHPAAAGIEAGTNVLYPPIGYGGMDASFLFQNVNGNCLGIINPRDNATTPFDDNGNMAWYFPCKPFSQDGSTKPNFTESEYYPGWACHTSEESRNAYYSLNSNADVYFTWDDIKNSTRNLVVYNGHVLDLSLLDWLETDQLTYPALFDDLRKSNLQGYDLSIVFTTSHEKKIGRCLTEIIRVGEVDSKTVGCIVSDIVLYVSIVFILSVVVAKFIVACYFRWIVSRKQGAYVIDNKSMVKHINEIEDWSENINSQGLNIGSQKPTFPGDQFPSNASRMETHKRRGSKFLPLNEVTLDLNNDSMRFGKSGDVVTMSTQNALRVSNETPDNKSFYGLHSRNPSALISSTSLLWNGAATNPMAAASEVRSLDPTDIHPDVVQQPPVDYMPFDFPLIHTICCVTCYSEGEQGIRSTLDSLTTTDYPNSHKLLMVLCDGLIKGSGNDKTTPETVLEMMTDFVIPPDEVQAYSYVAVASGTKRHNMAKIYAGFYKYDDETVPSERQQHVPMIVVVKCGTPDEQGSAKPGNRGKRDSQIILMSFLQKITFDERMSELEFQMLKNIWRITGLMADFYETVLMVDADTKVYPDSLTHMVAEMVRDPMIMGLCGETKIANKRQSWVTAIQVFEYYISHHQSKAFESVFGSVTCLPGCFSIYRIKSPKGSDGYWVPILANPDIVERYSDNVTTTLHKKNLLLLGEDRYLSSLMLKTFPKRKQVFVPKAACKTIAPDSFKVLLSQRRRWINSTVHNLFELVLIRDLCGTFCFSMQFVIGMELLGTLVLPLALCFTIYVIVFAIISNPTPILTLVLLSIILGLPGLIVVVTATRWSYLIWMLIYLFALPVWNFILPSYAYWKFDDFSWGETRTIAGGNDAEGKDDIEGEFDHSKIKMRTWREFERENLRNSQTIEPALY